jgi:hypothetical protein
MCVLESFRASYRAAVSTKHIRTVADLCRFGAGIRIDCGFCGASRTMDGFELATHCGSIPLAKIRPRLKCSRCGKKEARLAVLPPL